MRKDNTTIGAACALLFTTAVGVAGAQTLGPRHAVENIAPGQSGPGWAVACDADTDACVFEYDQGDDDNTTKDDFWPFPHGSRVTVMLNDAAECTCCTLLDPTYTITSLIGSQAANTTAMETTYYNGTSSTTEGGMCFRLELEGQTWTETINWYALVQSGQTSGFNVCSAATSNNPYSSNYTVYPTCAVDSDCNNVGGVAASTACGTDRSAIDLNAKKLPGVYMGCRCDSAADISYWVTR